MCVTSNNASNNCTMLRKLQKLLWKENGIRWVWQEHHIACLDHVINLVVQDFIRGLKGLKKKGKGKKDEAEDEDSGEDAEADSESEAEDEEDEEEQEEQEDADDDDVVVVGEGPESHDGDGKKKKTLAELLKNDPRNLKLQITLAKVQELSKVPPTPRLYL